MFDIKSMMDDARCYDELRQMRWPNGKQCVWCESKDVIRRGYDERHRGRQKYECKDCGKRFDDLSKTIFSGHRQPLKVWMLTLYFMGLNLSNSQIAQELELNVSDVQKMTSQLREGIYEKKTTQS